MIQVQIYLQTNSLGKLIAEHGVYASLSKSRHKISLNYDQLESSESDALAWDCRGLILAKIDGSDFQTIDGKLDLDVVIGDTKILAFGMRRFFNYGQGSAANINWSDPNLAVLEKLDGTLCIVYYDWFTKQWCVGTRSVPEADLLMDNGIFTFRSLFEKAVEDTTELTFNALTELLNKNYTYCFELTTPYNRIVVNYPNNGATLLAVRDLTTLKEADFSHDVVQYLNCVVPFVQAYIPTSVNEIVDWVSSLNPMEHEGVVVRDSNFNRIKVKNAAYVAYNRVRETLGASERNCMELILSEKDDDVIPFLPEEIVKNLLKLKVGVQAAIKKHDTAYRAARAQANTILPEDKKTFAILITRDKTLWSSPFFSMFDGKSADMKDFIQKNRKDGSWANGFLDRMLDLAKQAQP